MSSVLKVDQIQSDTGTVNVSSNLQFSGSSSTLQVGKALYLANTNNFALQFQDDVSGRLRIASSFSTFGDNNPFIIERPSSASAQNDAITIRSGGVVDLGKGQLKFPATQNASADANTLDDYEEGTFTPTLFGNTTAGTTTYVSQFGAYTKIGRQVTVQIFLNASAATGTGEWRMGGLPFTVGVNGYSVPIVSGLNWGGGTYIAVSTIGSTTNMELYYCADDALRVNQQMVNESQLYFFTLTYFV
jgi:hypothetical protein